MSALYLQQWLIILLFLFCFSLAVHVLFDGHLHKPDGWCGCVCTSEHPSEDGGSCNAIILQHDDLRKQHQQQDFICNMSWINVCQDMFIFCGVICLDPTTVVVKSCIFDSLDSLLWGIPGFKISDAILNVPALSAHLLFHGVSDWRGDDKWKQLVYY